MPHSRNAKSKKGADNREWGALCESLIRDELRRRGFTVRDYNFHVGQTVEIDIIAQSGDLFAFVEVKARAQGSDDPVEAVSKGKRNRMIRAADIYLSNLEYHATYRFDIATIIGTPEKYSLTYIEDAFMPPVRNR